MGLGHSRAGLRYNEIVLTSRQVREVLSIMSAGPAGVRGVLVGKDDCAGANFVSRRIATCNYRMNVQWGSLTRYGTNHSSSTPRYFHGWGFSRGWQHQQCTAPGIPNQCHWRLRPFPDTPSGSFGAIYDVEGMGSMSGSADQGMRQGTRWRAQLVVGTPNTNNESVQYRVCIFMRPNWKSGERCTTRTMSPGTSWNTVSTPWYTLPVTATDGRYLRSYVTITPSDASLFIGKWKVQRDGNP